MNSSSISCTTFRLRFFSSVPLAPRYMLSPNDSGVILCPFMTQQSSSILIFGTFIVTHLFAICSFRHLFCCITFGELLTSQQRFMRFVVHHLLSYHTQTKTTTTLYLPLHALQTVDPPPLTQLKLHRLSQAHFSVKVSYINVSHMRLYDFFNTQIWFLVGYFLSMCHIIIIVIG